MGENNEYVREEIGEMDAKYANNGSNMGYALEAWLKGLPMF